MTDQVLALVGGAIVTMDPDRPVVEDGVIIVEGPHIAAVGTRASTPVPAGARVIDTVGTVTIPGLVNTHTHVPQILLRGGASSDRQLVDWLFTALYPGLAQYSAADIRCGYRLFALEALRAGVTTMLAHDHVGSSDYLAAAAPAIEVLEAAGLRTFYARMFSDAVPAGSSPDAIAGLLSRRPTVKPAFVRRDTAAALADLERLIQTYDGRADGRIRIISSPSTATATSLTALRACDALSRDRGTLWTLHVSETSADRPAGMSAIRYLASEGLLSPRLLAGHCVHVDATDIDLLREHDVAVSTQPVSNGVLGSGIAPVVAMLQAGLRVGLGSDDANCNDSVNPLADLKTMAVMQRAVHRDVAVTDAHRLLELATLGGARALGIDGVTGSVVVGKRADLAVISLAHAHMVPHRDLASALVWQANGSEIRDVLVDGRVVLRDRRAAFLADEGEAAERDLLAEAAERSSRILDAAGL